MATQTVLFAASRRAMPFGLLLAGIVLFVVALGGSGALASAYTTAVGQALGVAG